MKCRGRERVEEMEKLICNKLREIEEKENIKILLAVESGSRAWGFASPDSDYDVRFIYVRQLDDYLRLNKIRDVIELPIDAVLDINGWDLQKTLRLLYQSNPTLFEWFSSPIVYMETEFADEIRDIMLEYFSMKKSLYHYISMAERNYRKSLKYEMVKAKKYFYVLRPILACRWILDKGTPPSMLFSELMRSELPESLLTDVTGLLDLKVNSPEIKEIPRIDRINQYLEQSIEEIKMILRQMDGRKEVVWEELNTLFLKTLRG